MNCRFSNLLFVLGLLPIVSVGAETLAHKTKEFCESKLTDGSASSRDTQLDFRISGEQIDNRFVRKSGIAAHIVANSTSKASVIVGFADGGNSGVSMWFDPNPRLKLRIGESVKMLTANQAGLHGVRASIEASGVDSLSISNFILGNIRHIRDYEDLKLKPDSIQEQVEWDQTRNVVHVTRFITPEHQYELTLHLDVGVVVKNVNGRFVLAKAPGHSGPIRFHVEALTGERLLTAIPIQDLIEPRYLSTLDRQTINMLSFVAYQEKWLAGAWRYMTYFGRDSMMSSKLMLNFLRPRAIEGALAGVIERINAEGEVSHEETLADYAFYLNGGKSFDPVQDYKMIDDDYMLAILLKDYFKMTADRDANLFLSRLMPNGQSYRQVVARNFRYIIYSAYPFAEHMREAREKDHQIALSQGYQYLIHLKKGESTGNWRDSDTGLGKGTIPLDVNAALVPSALLAVHDLMATDRYGFHDDVNAARAMSYYQTWHAEAPRLFEVHVKQDKAFEMAHAYMRQLGLDLSKVTAGSQGRPYQLTEDLAYYALALNQDGTKVDVMNSDEGSWLFFGLPSEKQLWTIADRLTKPFPYGLSSPVGMLIANPTFASESTRELFTRDHYHGTLVWGREHAVMLAGLLHQLKRTDLSEKTQSKLRDALRVLWSLLEKTAAYESAELWTWDPEAGQMVHVTYGTKPSHHTASNPIQTWSVAVSLLREAVGPEVERILSTHVHTAAAIGQ